MKTKIEEADLNFPNPLIFPYAKTRGCPKKVICTPKV